jgi:hypothetical protein
MDLSENHFGLAIVGGFITIMTSIVTASYSARANRKADDRRAKQALETELLKKFVEAPTKENVRANLKFLIDTGLLPNYAEGIQAYLTNNPGAAPTLGSAVGASREAFEKHTLFAMRSLIADFGLTDFQAAEIVGNFAYETAVFACLKSSFSLVGARAELVMPCGPDREGWRLRHSLKAMAWTWRRRLQVTGF